MMQRQEGNVLFLILIAVALFAALSYAVTQSSRGGGDADEERRIIEVSELLQFVGSARTAVQRMVFNGTAPTDIVLCNGGIDFCGLGNGFNDFCSTGANCLFAPEGGGMAHPRVFDNLTIYLETPANAFSVDRVGTALPELVTWFEEPATGSLPDVFCQEINKAVGISTTILEEATADLVHADGIALSGSWDFCYDSNPSPNIANISVHVLYAQ